MSDHPMTPNDLERELAQMTEPTTEPTALWREALQQTRRERGTRPIPGRRRLDLSRPIRPVELAIIGVIVVGLIAVMLPSLGKARSSARSVNAFAAMPSDTVPEMAVPSLGTPVETELATRSFFEADAFEPMESLRQDITEPQREQADMAAASSMLSMASAESAEVQEPAATYARAGAAFRDAAPAAPQPQPAPASRQIATSVAVSLVVPDTESALRSCRALLDETTGEYVEASRMYGRANNRSAELTLRVAASRQNSVLASIRQLGELERESIDAEDLTIVIADADARLRSLRQVEDELSDLLGRRADDTLADIVTAQSELGRTRGEIESLEARLRVQQQRVRLSTIEVEVRERDDPTPERLPAFGRTVVSAGRDAMGVLDGALYVTVLLSPIWGTLLVAWLVWRWLRRR